MRTSWRDAIVLVSAAAMSGAAVLFIAWWNWRQYVLFGEAGVSKQVAALLVFGPFGAVFIWLVWRYVRRNG